MVTHVHAIESLSLRRPQFSVRLETSVAPHPPKIIVDCIKVNFHTEDFSTSKAPLSQVIRE